MKKSRFSIQPSPYCTEGEWYLLCSVKDASDINEVIRVLQGVLDRAKESKDIIQMGDTTE